MTRHFIPLPRSAVFGRTLTTPRFETVSLQLLERYGASQLDAAIAEALDRNVPHPNRLLAIVAATFECQANRGGW
jgi:hypothetical protein